MLWRIATHEYWGISTMGGSAEQSEKIHLYISKWVRRSPDLRQYFLKPTMKKVSTYANSYVTFHSCSATSVRGPHTHELVIDEQAAGEERGGTKQIKAAIFQVSTSPDIHIVKSSTAQYIHGDFLYTWNNAEKLGYKKYQWSIAKHKNGVTDPYQIYQDVNPDNWLSNVPWIPDLNIRILRNARSNDEWLVEALGGISKSSGLVFNPHDLSACTCTRCPDNNKPCLPYADGHCPIVQYFMALEGCPAKKIPHSVQKALRKVGQRVEGVDWGKNSPCAYSATGKYKRIVFVLQSEEEVGANDDEKIQKAVDIARKWHIEIIRPDPREWSFNNIIADKGFAVHELFTTSRGDIEKNRMLFTLKRLVERHQILIPCKFEALISSLRNLTFDENGRIRKRNDHSFDSLIYAVSYYGEMADQTAFWEAVKGVKEKSPEDKKKAQKKEEEEKVIDDWEKWVKSKKYEREESDEDAEFPWGEGVEMW